MKRYIARLRGVLVLSFLVSLLWSGSAQAQLIACQSLNGPAPTIDGVVGAGEWPGPPNLHLQPPNYPIETNFTCVYDAQNLYVLVDAVDDTTDSNIDECLLVFDLPPDQKVVEIWRNDDDPNGPIRRRFESGAAGQSAMGFAGHRAYEFVLTLASLGLRPGSSIPFYSPWQEKFPGIWASMPYDNGCDPEDEECDPEYRDNIFPHGLAVHAAWDPNSSHEVITSVTGYARLSLGVAPVGAPSLNAWGMVGLVLMLGAMGCLALVKRSADSV
jgi:hypothetical protein